MPWEPVRKTIAFSFVLLAAMTLHAAPASAANDEHFDLLWGLQKVRAEQAWAKGKGSGAIIAIVDTGVDLQHEDLKGAFVAGRDFVDDDNDPDDENGHGTHVAGIAAARANNSLGVAGVAPQAKIMPIRVLDEDGEGNGNEIDAGIRWAADHGADVINLSLSGNVLLDALLGDGLSSAVNYAWSKGVVSVASTGNQGFSSSTSANVIMVTATTKYDTEASYATRPGSAQWSMAAPGGSSDEGNNTRVLSTYGKPGSSTKYAFMTGTSMAAPHVTGAAAVLRGLGYTPSQTVDRLLNNAVDLGASGRDSTFGSGRLDVAKAVGAAGAPSPTPKKTATPTPADDDDTPSPSKSATPILQPEETAIPLTESPDPTATSRRTRTPSPEETFTPPPSVETFTPPPVAVETATERTDDDAPWRPGLIAASVLLDVGCGGWWGCSHTPRTSPLKLSRARGTTRAATRSWRR